jgi:hypothetical protein
LAHLQAWEFPQVKPGEPYHDISIAYMLYLTPIIEIWISGFSPQAVQAISLTSQDAEIARGLVYGSGYPCTEI